MVISEMFKKITIEEDIEIRTIVKLRKKLDRVWNESNFIELDFEKVKFVDSSGINLLTNLANKLKARNGILLLNKVCNSLIDLFQITDLHQIAQIVEKGDYEGNLPN